MFRRAVTGVGMVPATNGCLAAGFCDRERQQSGWKVTGNAGRVAGSGSPVTGNKIRFWFTKRIGLPVIDLLELGKGGVYRAMHEPRCDQFADRRARSMMSIAFAFYLRHTIKSSVR